MHIEFTARQNWVYCTILFHLATVDATGYKTQPMLQYSVVRINHCNFLLQTKKKPADFTVFLVR